MEQSDVELARLLEHPAIWRGRSVAPTQSLATGFAALDERLPGGGWPRNTLIEILVTRFGVGELYLLLPALARLTRGSTPRWCAWISPPLEPYAPALAAHGVALSHVLIVRAGTDPALWAFEQALRSGACDAAMAWLRRPRVQTIRRLQLAAERGRALGVLFRPFSAARESSYASLRMAIEPVTGGIRATILKSRGGLRGSVEIATGD
jgi:hypothetical protein